jgi:hypothetical protein
MLMGIGRLDRGGGPHGLGLGGPGFESTRIRRFATPREFGVALVAPQEQGGQAPARPHDDTREGSRSSGRVTRETKEEIMRTTDTALHHARWRPRLGAILEAGAAVRTLVARLVTGGDRPPDA